MIMDRINNICVVGLGYVGLPLAVALSKKYNVIGYDIDESRVSKLNNYYDVTSELSEEELRAASNVKYTTNLNELVESNVYIVTVPTPIDSNNKPNLTPVIKATEMIGSIINVGDIIIYESTVYPGATEEVCVPILNKQSGLKYNEQFFVGYSPERINPGDKSNRLENIVKVTSGSDVKTAKLVDDIYSSIIHAGTFPAKSIKVAEGSKVIENIQRDLNIALINELFQVFNAIDINIMDVIEAASTKWNFMKLTPGLVGGHCISVDPYYLIHKSQSVGYIPDLIKKAREINNGMPAYVVNDFVDKLLLNKINPVGLEILLLGFSFKPDCPDIRNTKVFDLYKILISKGFNVTVIDQIVNKKEVYDEYGINIINSIQDIDFNRFKIGFVGTEHSDFSLILDKFDFIYNFRSEG
jgi:UDP-N-acetyl-D-galactosamine dehydrogenase